MKAALIILCFILITPYNSFAQNPEMVFVKGSMYKMGNDEGDKDERPSHFVTLNDFYIAKNEITLDDWAKFLKARKEKDLENRDISLNKLLQFDDTGKIIFNPSKIAADLACPVHDINWLQAVDFCNWLSEINGFEECYKIENKQYILNPKANGYRLPIEAEWEYAARGGEQSKNYIYSGNNICSEVGWTKENSNKVLHNTATKAPNELGIYDMTGNVSEWCYDIYDDDFYSSSESSENPTGFTKGRKRVIRGGSFNDKENECTVTVRDRESQTSEEKYVGFRIARNAK